MSADLPPEDPSRPPGTEQSHTPTRRDRFRPLELLVIAGIVAVFVGLIVLLSSRSPQLAFVFGGVAFIASLLLLAMLALTGKPTGEERSDLDEQDRDRGH